MGKNTASKSRLKDQPLAKRTKELSKHTMRKNSDPSLPSLDVFTNSPGLAHIPEQILMNLDQKDLKKCIEINENWKGIVKNPWFFFKACVYKGLFGGLITL